MNLPVLVCDDSQTARKQAARVLASHWQVEPVFASNGAQAMESLRDGAAGLMLLDLNMPVMDGYQVLEALREEALAVPVVVVSGDVQQEARRRALDLGAVDFIAKPLSGDTLQRAIRACPPNTRPEPVRGVQAGRQPNTPTVSEWDCYAEIANIAVGRAADLLARLLGVFVHMPLPHVELLEACDLHMALSAGEGDRASSISQGFIASRVNGEALLLVHDSSFPHLARLLHNEDTIGRDVEMELLMDVGNIVIGACLKGIAEQINLEFSLGHPVILDGDRHREDFERHAGTGTLAVEMNISFEDDGLNATLLLLFDNSSLAALSEITASLR